MKAGQLASGSMCELRVPSYSGRKRMPRAEPPAPSTRRKAGQARITDAFLNDGSDIIRFVKIPSEYMYSQIIHVMSHLENRIAVRSNSPTEVEPSSHLWWPTVSEWTPKADLPHQPEVDGLSLSLTQPKPSH